MHLYEKGRSFCCFTDLASPPGAQLGIALGFLVPPHMVMNSQNIEELGQGLSRLCYAVAIFSTIVLAAIVIGEM
ncbi:hypothetical protein ANAPC5_01346 [Anaplasma phagocytophilum]|nr:hypothetical protein ANAPC5_01346 [Anaplasma phagocytophilum]